MLYTEVPLKKAYRDLGQLVKAARYQNRTAIITEHGRPAAMITPVPDYIVIRDISVNVLDSEGWRERAIDAWIEAAAEDPGYGFLVVEHHDSGEDIAVVEHDRWDDETGERVEGGDRYVLSAQWPDGLDPADRGKGTADVTIAARPAPTG